MPLTSLQTKIIRILASHRSKDSYLAGGAALHRLPNSKRYSADLDFFHDKEAFVAEAFLNDKKVLKKEGFIVEVQMSLPGYVRAQVGNSLLGWTKVEWAHDTAWRFMPLVADDEVGYTLHLVDLAINKLLALVGRDEPRDFLDIFTAIEQILPLGPMCWAASGKDPGFTPWTLLELLQRRGRFQPEDFARLNLTKTVDVRELKVLWQTYLAEAAKFIESRPANEVGCLYYSFETKTFVDPTEKENVAVHYGAKGGVWPIIQAT